VITALQHPSDTLVLLEKMIGTQIKYHPGATPLSIATASNLLVCMTWKNDNRLALFTGLAELGGKMLFFQLSYHIQTAEYVCLRPAARYYGVSSDEKLFRRDALYLRNSQLSKKPPIPGIVRCNTCGCYPQRSAPQYRGSSLFPGSDNSIFLTLPDATQVTN
jgi:hypothetical protein